MNREVKPLVFKDVIRNEMTYFDSIRHFRPDWTDKECHDYLWNMTCYPFSSEMVISQLNSQLGNTHEPKQ
jgi:hypothetical protein